MNIDTDTQWAFTAADQEVHGREGRLPAVAARQPRRPDKPNKKYIDPRGWLHSARRATARLVEAFKDLGCFGKFDF